MYLLSKIFDQHSLIYTLKDPWCTFTHRVTDTLSTLLGHSDLVFVYTTYGFAQIVDKTNVTQVVKKPISRKKTSSRKQSTSADGKKLKSCNLSQNMTTQVETATKNGHHRKRTASKRGRANDNTPIVNKVCATVSSSNIIKSESDRPHNTRKTRPKTRNRNNPRSPRKKTVVDYREYNDSSNASPAKRPPTKKYRVANTTSSETRIAAQKMITRKRLQDLSPVGSWVKLIGTATSPKPIIPIKAIKLETGGTVVKTEKTLCKVIRITIRTNL